MKIKEYYLKIKNAFEVNRKSIYICSLIFTLAFSIFNRILGIVKESIWHEAISIYYFVLVLIRGIVILFIYKTIKDKKLKYGKLADRAIEDLKNGVYYIKLIVSIVGMDNKM